MGNEIFVPTEADNSQGVVAGAFDASSLLPKTTNVTVLGYELEIVEYLKEKGGCPSNLKIIDCPLIPMGTEFDLKILHGGSAMVTAIKMAKEMANERNGGVVSSGPTGVFYGTATTLLKTIPNVRRPGLVIQLPNNTFLIDAGGNVDSEPRHLHDFAKMTDAYCKVLGIQPVIGLLSNGSEPCKGNKLTKETYSLLTKDKTLKFIGNVEGTDIVSGTVNVLVTDGFSGNIALKVAEGIGKMMIQQAIDTCGIDHPLVREYSNKLDHRRQNGAFILGLCTPCIKTHGAGDPTSIRNAILHLDDLLNKDIIGQITKVMAQ